MRQHFPPQMNKYLQVVNCKKSSPAVRDVTLKSGNHSQEAGAWQKWPGPGLQFQAAGFLGFRKTKSKQQSLKYFKKTLMKYLKDVSNWIIKKKKKEGNWWSPSGSPSPLGLCKGEMITLEGTLRPGSPTRRARSRYLLWLRKGWGEKKQPAE